MSDFAPPASIQDEVMQFLLSTPTPQQIINFRASESAQLRLRYLLDANRNETITVDEEAELEEASAVNQFMMTLKAKAHESLK